MEWNAAEGGRRPAWMLGTQGEDRPSPRQFSHRGQSSAPCPCSSIPGAGGGSLTQPAHLRACA